MSRTGRFREEDWESLELSPSKTEQKKTMERLQAMGMYLAALPVKKLEQLSLSERTLDELKALASITSFEAKRRQSQLIGKFLRAEDMDTILSQLMSWQTPKLQGQLERWVDRVIEGEEEGIKEFSRQFKDVEKHTLRQLVMRLKSQEDNELYNQHKRILKTYLTQFMII